MAWFKVDDMLHSHPKARKAGVAAMGLWALAGAHSCAYKEDGFVPEWFVVSWPNGKRLAAQLAEAELWEAGQKNGVVGWWFHDWCDYQLTADEIEKDRQLARARQQKLRDGRRAARKAAIEKGDDA